MIGIPDSRNSSQSPGREELFSAGLTYMESGEYGFAYYCLSNIENPDIAVLYNMAYCCYRISWYEQSYSLLKDAELEDFRMSLDEFREKAIAGGYDKELNEIYLRTRVSRLQALQTQIRLRIQELFQEQQEQLKQ